MDGVRLQDAYSVLNEKYETLRAQLAAKDAVIAEACEIISSLLYECGEFGAVKDRARTLLAAHAPKPCGTPVRLPERKDMMRAPKLIYMWIDNRGRIPRWAFWLWPSAHWCPEMDDLLILDNTYDCFCGFKQEPRHD